MCLGMFAWASSLFIAVPATNSLTIFSTAPTLTTSANNMLTTSSSTLPISQHKLDLLPLTQKNVLSLTSWQYFSIVTTHFHGGKGDKFLTTTATSSTTRTRQMLHNNPSAATISKGNLAPTVAQSW